MNKDEFKRRFTEGWKLERCIDFDQALEGLLADARYAQKLADERESWRLRAKQAEYEARGAKLRYEEAEDLLEEYVGIVDAVTEALGPMTRKDREDQLDCDATVSIRVRNLQAVLDRVRTRSERAETELREVLSVLEGGGPATETLFALAQRGTAKKIRALLGLTLAPEVGS